MKVTSDVVESIRDLARRDYPHEACGALLGNDHTITEVLPLANSTTEEARRRYRIRPEDYRRVEGRARATQKELVGFFHSHPDHAAAPSAYDLEQAWPNLVYLIVSVTRDRAGELTGWRLSEDRSRFDQILTR